MALGSVLLKPQPVATPLPPRTSLDDAIVDLIEVFARNPEGAAAAAEVAARTFFGVVDDEVIARITQRIK